MNKTYSVKQIKDIKTGDVIKSARVRVTDVELSVPDAKEVTLTYSNGHSGTFHGTQRLGIYR